MERGVAILNLGAWKDFDVKERLQDVGLWECSERWRVWALLEWRAREGNGNPLQCSCLENPMDGGAWWAAVHGVAKSWTWLSNFTFTFHFHALEKEMATLSSVLAWRIPGASEPGGLPSMGSHRVRHDWSVLAAAAEWRAWGWGYWDYTVDSGFTRLGMSGSLVGTSFLKSWEATASFWTG